MNYFGFTLFVILLCFRATDSANTGLRKKRSLQGTCGGLTCNQREECVQSEDGEEKCMCKDGYIGDYCNDIDECADDYPCESPQNGGYCVDNDPPQKYTCGCAKGYIDDDSQVDPKHGPLGCIEVDECADGTHNCHPSHGVCSNTAGSFECACATGYVGNGVSTCDAVVIEESEEEDPCNPNPCNTDNQVCQIDSTQTNGTIGYNCTCIEGWFSITGVGKCQDVDECIQGTHDCDINASCENIPGEWICECNSGYEGSGKFCTDIDDCAVNTTICDPAYLCVNRPGTFECVDPTPAPTPAPTPPPTRKVVVTASNTTATTSRPPLPNTQA